MNLEFKSSLGWICLLALPLGLAAEDRWSWVHPLPQGNTLNDVVFTGPTVGHAAGEAGTLLRTVDRGRSWARQSVGPLALRAIRFSGADTGYAVGDSGAIFRTVDAGLRWRKLESGTKERFRSLDFRDSRNGFAAGDSGTLLKTSDAGGTWTAVSSGTSDHIIGIHFPAPLTGYLIDANGNIHRSEDGGVHWGPPVNISRSSKSVRFLSPDTGYVLSDTAVFMTLDRGRQWRSVFRIPGKFLEAAHFQDRDTLHVLANDGGVHHSVDGGQNWTAATALPESPRQISVFFVDGKTGYAVGADGVMLKSEAWTSAWSPLGLNMLTSGVSVGKFPIEFRFPSRSTAYLSFYEHLIKTMDGGVTWERAAVPLNGKKINCLYFFDDTHGLAAGKTTGGAGYLDGTSDGGRSWHPVREWPGKEITRMDFPTPKIGYLMSLKGGYKTRDGGLTWDSIPLPTESYIFRSQFLDSALGFALSERGVFRTRDGGNGWDSLALPLDTAQGGEGLTGIHFLSKDVGFISTQRESLLKTTDGGLTWRRIGRFSIPGVWPSFHFPNQTTGYAVGSGGVVLKTVDGGENWSRVNAGANSTFLGIAFPDTGTGFVAGVSGTGVLTVLRVDRQSIDVRSANRKHPGIEIQLGRQGEFTYRLDKRMRVTAMLFDSRGRRAASVLDVTQNAGEYRSKLPSVSLPKGTYLLDFKAAAFRRSIPVLHR